MSYHSDLQTCYSQQARQFDHSRKRKRPEVDQLLQDLVVKEGVTVVDLGCGSGRLYPLLKEYFGETPFRYVGVDSAEGMIDYAREQYPDAEWVCASMQEYVVGLDQQSVDVIICLASMQHLQGVQLQQAFLQNCWRALSYEGQGFLINWSWSEWFVKKYRKEVCKACVASLFGSFDWNDVFIPWKDPQWRENKKVYRRMYHIFGLREMVILCRQTFFGVKKSGYIMQSGALGDEWRQARNTYVVLEK